MTRGMSSFGHRILGERDWLADRISEWYHDQDVVTDRGFDLTDDTAEFVYELPTGRRFEVRIRELS